MNRFRNVALRRPPRAFRKMRVVPPTGNDVPVQVRNHVAELREIYFVRMQSLDDFLLHRVENVPKLYSFFRRE